MPNQINDLNRATSNIAINRQQSEKDIQNALAELEKQTEARNKAHQAELEKRPPTSPYNSPPSKGSVKR